MSAAAVERQRLFSEQTVDCGHDLSAPHRCRAISVVVASAAFGSILPISTQSGTGRQISPGAHWASESQTDGSHQPTSSFVFHVEPTGH